MGLIWNRANFDWPSIPTDSISNKWFKLTVKKYLSRYITVPIKATISAGYDGYTEGKVFSKSYFWWFHFWFSDTDTNSKFAWTFPVNTPTRTPTRCRIALEGKLFTRWQCYDRDIFFWSFSVIFQNLYFSLFYTVSLEEWNHLIDQFMVKLFLAWNEGQSESHSILIHL